MVIRELKDGSCYVSLQEDHAELSAQFAARWGNARFSKLRPYQTMVFATTYHDSGYREWEGNPPMNVEKGRPYAHREDVPNFEAVELKAYAKNVEWISSQGLYAGLLVSMHRTGLWHNRYNIFNEPAGRLRERSAAVQNAKKAMEAKQEELKQTLAAKQPGFANELAYNYMVLQIFDLLSLYVCSGSAENVEFPQRFNQKAFRLYREPDKCRLEPPLFERPTNFSIRVVEYPSRVAAATDKISVSLI